MLQSLEVVVPPITEPFDIEMVKAYLRISNDAMTNLLYLLSIGARAHVEKELRRSFLTQTLRATMMPERGVIPHMSGVVVPDQYDFRLPHPPHQSVISVEIEITPGVFQITDPVNYAVRGSSLLNVEIYPYAWEALQMMPFLTRYYNPKIKITYVAGYTDVNLIPPEYIIHLYQAIEHKYLNMDGNATPLPTHGDALRMPHL